MSPGTRRRVIFYSVGAAGGLVCVALGATAGQTLAVGAVVGLVLAVVFVAAALGERRAKRPPGRR